MFRSHRKSHRRVHLALVAAVAMLFGGCASQDMRAGEKLKCPPGQARICTYKMGREEDCACKFEEDFEEIFRPDRRQ